MTVAIRAENIGKFYSLNRAEDSGFSRALARWINPASAVEQGIWALRDINFTVREGESVGIIGPNGAGKTTLFRMLCSITKPSQGNLSVKGKVRALIDLGAGFHPELSGRENIFLYGSILGIKKEDIDNNINEIIAFSELDEFIDIPVKRYSSGMFLRLGFSVAAHLHPDILLLDEILSVGDLAFQKKCFDRVYEYMNSKRVFLLISHQIHHIENLCKRVIYLKDGRIVFDGSTDQAISLYMRDQDSPESSEDKSIHGFRRQAGEFAIESVSLRDCEDSSIDTAVLGSHLMVRIDYDSPIPLNHPKVEIAINCQGRRIGQANTVSDNTRAHSLSGKGRIYFQWPRCFLTPNSYSVDIFVSDGETLADIFVWENCLRFHISAPSNYRIGSGNPGWVKIPGTWSFQ